MNCLASVEACNKTSAFALSLNLTQKGNIWSVRHPFTRCANALKTSQAFNEYNRSRCALGNITRQGSYERNYANYPGRLCKHIQLDADHSMLRNMNNSALDIAFCVILYDPLNCH